MSLFLTRALLFFVHLLPTFFITTHGNFSEQFAKTTATNQRINKMSHLHFYFHDIVGGKKPTAVRVAGPKKGFGTTAIIDDPLTEGPKPGSKVVGRAQGMYAIASQHDTALLVAVNFAFLQGRFNGSSISVLGRNRVVDPVREMPVVGGSGMFRFARGYALARTIRYNQKTGDAVVEYDMYVMHG